MSATEVESASAKGARRLKHLPFLSRASSPPNSTFSPSDILPKDGHTPYPKRPQSDMLPSDQGDEELMFGPPTKEEISRDGSTSSPNVFDDPDEQQENETDPTTTHASDEPGAYDLKPPPPAVSHDNIEALAERFFSCDHLDCVLRDQSAGPRFMQFLNQYKPQYATTLTHYIESKKAITAIEYANAIAEQIPTAADEPPCVAATVEDGFDAKLKQIAGDLVEEALSSYLTHRLVGLATDTLVKDITGNSLPVMKELIPNLAEVYCITDLSLRDNPIVYASEEFYNTTQYGREYVIGRNCRFLQGPRTSDSAVRRMIEALSAGEELCETLVNYRRDGTPFMNLLMIAPLYDNKGDVRYFLGCQIDVSPLLEGGKGMDTFSQVLAQDREESRFGVSSGKEPLNLLGELGQMLNEPEADFVINKMRNTSSQASGSSTPQKPRRPNARRILSVDDATDGNRFQSLSALWPDPGLGHSGRLPGVYRNYLLVRPYPSLRITFTSPTLRIPGLLQTKLLDRIGGPESLREGILEALQSGTGLTAKVHWLPNGSNQGKRASRQSIGSSDGKPRWIHCTPLFGSDEKVGVWMVILVENEEVTGLLNRQQSTHSQGRYDSANGTYGAFSDRQSGGGNPLYAGYLKEEGKDGRPGTEGTQQTSDSARERRDVDEQFRDF